MADDRDPGPADSSSGPAGGARSAWGRFCRRRRHGRPGSRLGYPTFDLDVAYARARPTRADGRRAGRARRDSARSASRAPIPDRRAQPCQRRQLHLCQRPTEHSTSLAMSPESATMRIFGGRPRSQRSRAFEVRVASLEPPDRDEAGREPDQGPVDGRGVLGDRRRAAATRPKKSSKSAQAPAPASTPARAASRPGPATWRASRAWSSLPQPSQMPRSEISPPHSLWTISARRALRAGGVLVAPVQQGDQGRPEVEALLGQEVLVAGRAFLVGAALEDALLDQPAEPGREDVAGDPERALDLAEAAVAVHHVADDQQRPALADHLERLGDGADLAGIAVVKHRLIFAHSVASNN